MNERSKTNGPLEGLRVIELGSIVAASFASRLLADLGAEVIKVERPDKPDPLRTWGQGSIAGRSLWWSVQSRNKKLITLDLSQEAGQDVFRSLCATSDVVIENFRPGTLEKWNLGPDVLAEVNPGLIVARISGFGQTGPNRMRPCFAAVAEALGGLRFINGEPGGPPLRLGLSLGDTIAGLFAAQGVLAAMVEREKSGLGQVIDVALTESCLAIMESAIAEYDALGKVRRPAGTCIPGVVPSNVFRTQDDHWFVIAATEQRMFERLLVAMERPDLVGDPRFASHRERARHQGELEELIAAWARTKNVQDLSDILNANDIACGAVYSVAEIVKDRQFEARNALVEHDHELIGSFIAQGVAPVFSRTPGRVRWSGKWVSGCDNDEILKNMLGVPEHEIAHLKKSKII